MLFKFAVNKNLAPYMLYLAGLTHISSGITVEEIIQMLRRTNEVYKFVVGFLRSCAEKKSVRCYMLKITKKKVCRATCKKKRKH